MKTELIMLALLTFGIYLLCVTEKRSHGNRTIVRVPPLGEVIQRWRNRK
jgi:hypothetical protein